MSQEPPNIKDDVLKGLNLTSEEVNKFEKAFKDPKFLELFSEYAKEVADPKAREENDLYLRQLESQGKAEEIYGKGVQLIVPEQGFVIKTRDKSSGKKLFINVCTSSKMDPHSLEEARGPDGRPGRMMNVPFTLGTLKDGKDRKGGECSVVDFVVNHETKDFALGKPNVMQLLADTAMDAVERRDKVKVDRRFSLPKIKYKGTEACPQPHVLSIRTDGSSKPGERIQPLPAGGSVGEVGKAAAASGPKTVAATAASASASASAPLLGLSAAAAAPGAGARSDFAFPAAAPKKKTPALPKTPLDAGYRHPGGLETPSHELLHRGQQDMAAAWADAGRGLKVDVVTPTELVVRVRLPGVTSAAAAELDIGLRTLSLKVPGKYLLNLPLPYQVDEARGKAKFDKSKQTLEVVLPVIPPPAAERPPANMPAANSGEGEDSPEAGEVAALPSPQSAEKPEKEMPPPAVHGVQLASKAAQAERPDTLESGAGAAAAAQQSPREPSSTVSSSTSPAKTTDDKEESTSPADGSVSGDSTENERRWRELHVSQDKAESGPAAAAEASVTLVQVAASAASPNSDSVGPDEVVRSVATSSAAVAPGRALPVKKAGSEETAEVATKATSAGVEQVTYKPTYLKPRLNRALAEDLD